MIKKIYLASLLFVGTMASCTSTIDGPDASVDMTADKLQQVVSLNQTVANQNKFTFTTSPAMTVQILDQDENIIATGTEGVIVGVPPLSKLIVRAMNQDGSIVSYSKDCTITEYVDVPEIYKNLFGSEFTSQTWTWDTDASDGVWGNGGYLSNTGPGWWVVQASDIDEQCEGKGYAKDGLDGWMTFTLAGKKVTTSRGESGSLSWDLTAIAKDGWDLGRLTFSGTVPLMGIQVNENNRRELNYQILQMDGEHLRLCAPETGSGEGGTAWFWNFKVKK